MHHSHLTLHHFLQQAADRGPGRDCRPAWITELINEVAELFEPVAGVGRVGFDCQPIENRWLIALYLGSTEIVGGKQDGQFRFTNFRFNVSPLVERFSRIDRLDWKSFPDCSAKTDLSYMTIEGRIGEAPVCLQIFSVPPRDAGPAFRQYPNGSSEPV